MQDRNDRPKISKNQKSKNESILVKIQWKLEKKWKLKAGKTSTYLRRQKKKVIQYGVQQEMTELRGFFGSQNF